MAGALLLGLCAAISDVGWDEELEVLRGLCRRVREPGYEYEWCHRGSMRQYHTSTPVVLGRFDDGSSRRPMRHVFGGGDACGVGKRREASVEFRCCPGDFDAADSDQPPGDAAQAELTRADRLRAATRLQSVVEEAPCVYRAVVCTPAVCGGGRTRPKRHGVMSAQEIESLRDEARAMFFHAYDGYMNHAYPDGELRPLSCTGGSFGLVNISAVTLIDSLDALAVLGNTSEFRSAVQRVVDTVSFDVDVNVSVFETTIRVLGGLLSAHVIATTPPFSDGWDYDGGLLRLAHDLGGRLLAAFPPTGLNATGVPYGTVNLRHGVPPAETRVASVAGAGSLTIEFSVLSALTGEPSFAYAANYAVRRLYELRSPIGLLGKHVHIGSGEWTEVASNIGTNADSYFEYLLKMDLLFDDVNSWRMFEDLYEHVMTFQTRGDWYAEVHMGSGQAMRHRAEGLYAFWPGMQAMIGDIGPATHTLNALMSVWREKGFFPEAYLYKELTVSRDGNDAAYLLRPEVIESLVYVRRATGDNSWLWAGLDVMRSLQRWCKTECGYATVTDVSNASYPRDDQMPSFLLSETLKYLYLLFADALGDGHWLLRDGGKPGGWVMTTEAHPFPVSRFRGSVPEIARATAAKGLLSRPAADRECSRADETAWVRSYDTAFVPDAGPDDPPPATKSGDDLRKMMKEAFGIE
eukprot:TRINITY_DN19771_c0_g1_i1.p1 TRINITY_DN19771_c0_g1~~TRINITY_DN19771_c0_g1_i1.p1  ORF type:complete len:691 (+),score=215.59 TRINITY_DN19771_c0_g1_i1:55-2127(+)